MRWKCPLRLELTVWIHRCPFLPLDALEPYDLPNRTCSPPAPPAPPPAAAPAPGGFAGTLGVLIYVAPEFPNYPKDKAECERRANYLKYRVTSSINV